MNPQRLDESLSITPTPAGSAGVGETPQTTNQSILLGGPWEMRVGRFVIERELGRGGNGIVFLAYDSSLDRKVALKLPRPEAWLPGEVRERFFREARAAGALDHPNLVPVYEIGEAGPVIFIASAYCEGPNLAQWLAGKNGGVDPRLAARLVADLAGAIQHTHEQGILHRDLKPSNILLFPINESPSPVSNGLPFIPRITDFGLAKLMEAAIENTRSSLILGTPLYMAPEQAEHNAKEIGPGTDVYGLGCILQELVTGRPLFEGLNALEIVEQLRSQDSIKVPRGNTSWPNDLLTIVKKCLNKPVADRYLSSAQLQQDLLRFLRDEPIIARPDSWRKAIQRWIRHPLRIREAAYLAMVTNCALASWIAVNGLLIATGVAPVRPGTRLDEVAWHSLVMGSVLHLPQVWLGWQVAGNKRWAALWVALIGWCESAFVLATLLGIGPAPFGGYYDDRGFMSLVFTLLLILFASQGATGTLAVIAIGSREKRQPSG